MGNWLRRNFVFELTAIKLKVLLMYLIMLSSNSLGQSCPKIFDMSKRCKEGLLARQLQRPKKSTKEIRLMLQLAKSSFDQQ